MASLTMKETTHMQGLIDRHFDALEPRRLLSPVIEDPGWSPPGAQLFGLDPAGLPVGLGTVNEQNRVIRYNRDGSRASSFAIDPKHRAGFFAGWGELAIDGAGRIIHAYAADRTKNSDPWPDYTRLRRFNADGTPDLTVGRTGEVAIVPPGSSGNHVWIQNMVANTRGQIALSTRHVPEIVHLARFTPEGELDTAWGESGYVRLKPNGGVVIVFDILLRDDGSMHVIGADGAGAFVLALDENGRTRSDFGPDGRFVFPSAFRKHLTSVLTVDEQDRLYISVGERPPRLYPDNAMPGGLVPRSLTRLLPDGSVDRTFGTDGFVTLDSTDGYMITTNLTGGDDVVTLVGGRVSLEDVGEGGSNRFTLRTSRGASVALGYGRNVVDTFDGDDTINATTGRDTLRTRGGNDLILKAARYGVRDPLADTIDTGAGDDTLRGSLAPDLLIGGDGYDRAVLDDDDLASGIELILET